MSIKIAVGQNVVLTETQRTLLPSFPGWGAPDEFDHFGEAEAGSHGVVTSVQSHGSNPWTRYVVKLDDGSRIIGTADVKAVR